MRARNIKPGFFLNAELSEVCFSTRLLFIGLWCYSDREGRFEWKPKQIKASIFPYDNVNIEKLLKNLLSLNVITCHDGIGYVEHFKKHQNPHPHEAKSTLPEKPKQNQCHDMSLHVTKCNADVMIPDSLIPDIRIPDSTPKGVGDSDKPKSPRTKMSDEEWFESLFKNEAYTGIDIKREYGKCKAWCDNKQIRTVTRTRFLNWLNRVDKPIISKNMKSKDEQIREENHEAARRFVERGGV